MPTPAEKKAIMFLASVAVLGGAVRVLRTVGMMESAPPAARAALDRQLDAVDSAREAGRRGGGRRRGGRGGQGATASAARGARSRRRADSAAVDSIPRATRYARRPGRVSASAADVARDSSRERVAVRPPAVRPPVDLDVASAGEIEALPSIGPVIARRIVDDRNLHGPFGSLDNLQRVKGIGPALAARVAAMVTFSGKPRPLIAIPADSSPHRTKSRRVRVRAPRAHDPPSFRPPSPASRLPTWPHLSSPSSASAISSFARG